MSESRGSPKVSRQKAKEEIEDGMISWERQEDFCDTKMVEFDFERHSDEAAPVKIFIQKPPVAGSD